MHANRKIIDKINKMFNQTAKKMDNQTKNAQIKRVINYLKANGPSTMLQISFGTGILRANICRYLSWLENKGQISVDHKDICPITKHKAGFYRYKAKNIRNEKQQRSATEKA